MWRSSKLKKNDIWFRSIHIQGKGGFLQNPHRLWRILFSGIKIYFSTGTLIILYIYYYIKVVFMTCEILFQIPKGMNLRPMNLICTKPCIKHCWPGYVIPRGLKHSQVIGQKSNNFPWALLLTGSPLKSYTYFPPCKTELPLDKFCVSPVHLKGPQKSLLRKV